MANLRDIIVPEVKSSEPAVLVGSPSQVQWATDKCRPKVLKEVNKYRPDIGAALAVHETDATWWIANRFRTFAQIRWPDKWAAAAQPKPTQPQPVAQPRPTETVVLRAIFGQRRGESSPEFLDAMDQFSCDVNDSWIPDRLEAHRQSSEFTAVAVFDIKIPYDEIRKRLQEAPVKISGATVNPI